MSLSKNLLDAVRILFLIAVIPVAGCAQSNVGRISGTVTDASGAGVPDCVVALRDARTGLEQKIRTDEAGTYVFPSVQAGTYDVRAERQGFRASSKTGLVLDAASRRVVDFTLEVGQVSESVSVTATAQQVQANSGNVGSVISERQLTQLALNGRDYTQLLRLIPGAATTTLNTFNPQLSLTQQRINGIRTSSAYFTIDGSENHDNGANDNAIVNPNVDAIAEVKIDTASYSAEFGGRAGAMVNVVTKSGTRDFHGSLFEFVRNDAFDARSFFATRVDPLRFNDFGGTIGGPIYIPNRFNRNRDKLFFFFSEEWKYVRQGQTTVNTVPTMAERAGDFRDSSLPAPIDPTTGQPFPDRIVPQSRWSTNGPLLLKPYPAPNFVGPGGNFVATGMNQTDFREELVRIDYNISSTTQLNWRLANDKWYIVFPFRNNNLGITPNPRPRPGYVSSINVQHAFSPTMLNYASFSVSKNSIVGDPDVTAVQRSTLGLTFPEIFRANRSAAAPAVNIGGFTGYNANDRIKNGNGTLQVRDDFTKIIGAHTLKAGAQITRARKNENTNVRDEGSVTFNTSARNTTRNAVADVLLGNFQSYVEPEADSFWWARSSQYEFYVQDTWRASRRLTLELGVRYNIIPSFTNAQGNASTFLPRLYNRANAPQVDPSSGALLGGGDVYNGIAIYGSEFPEAARGRLPQYDDPAVQRLFVGLPEAGSKTNYNDWGPRVGIAWDLFGDGRTAIRSGFGIFYDRVGSNQLSGQAQNPPFVNTANIFDGSIDNPGGGTSRSFPTDVRAWPEVLPTPKIVSYNFGVQRELPGAIILDASYVGNIGRHFVFTRDLNQLLPGTRLSPPNSSINVNALRPYPGYGAINLRDASDNSNYNSLQVTANRRMSGRLAFGVSYTFSKTMDTVGGGTPQNSYAPKDDVGLASIHRAHIFSVNYIYSLPLFANSNALVRSVLGGWEISGVTTAQSGAPTSVTVPTDIARIGASSSRGSVIGDPNLPSDERTPARWFNTDVFLPPERMTQGQFGNSGRNILIGPGFHQWDLSLLKNFRIRERASFQFRAESFNVFNHTNFTGLNTTVRLDNAGRPTAGYGAVNAAGPGRVLSFGLKLLF
jgi:hypothetical protein